MSLDLDELYKNNNEQEAPKNLKFRNLLIVCFCLLALNLLGYFLLKLDFIKEKHFENFLLLEYIVFAFPIIHYVQRYKLTYRILLACTIVLILILFYYFLPGDFFIITAFLSLFFLCFLLIPENQWKH